MKVIWLSVAEKELDEALQWYAEQHALPAAERLLLELEQALNQISRQPDRYPVIFNNYRKIKLAHFPYQLFYRTLDSKTVEVVSFFHATRKPIAWDKR